jgi:glycogen(starch) synthase
MKSPEELAGNIFFHSLHVPKIGWMRTGYLGCILAVRRKLKEIKPDLVHGQGTERDAALCAIFSGYPSVLTIHGNMGLIAKINRACTLSFYWLAAKLEALTLPRANGVICISSYTQQAVRSLVQRTWLVPNAVDSSFFEIRNVPESPVRILCVGSVDQRKNQNALIRALDGIQDGVDFELIFLGEAFSGSAYTREFLELVTARPWCRYRGFVDREGLKQHLATASGLILPSLEDNCPMVILEAMAAGVPVAASQVGGIPDLVRHGETGVLFDPLDKSAMATAFKELLATSSQPRAVRAKKEALDRFHPKVVARRHEVIYQEVLSANGT